MEIYLNFKINRFRENKQKGGLWSTPRSSEKSAKFENSKNEKKQHATNRFLECFGEPECFR